MKKIISAILILTLVLGASCSVYADPINNNFLEPINKADYEGDIIDILNQDQNIDLINNFNNANIQENKQNEGCLSKEDIKLDPNAVVINNFNDKTYLNAKSVIISENVTEIPQEAFKGCTKLKKITVLGNVKSIKKGTFNKCDNLKEVILPNTIETIGEFAFKDCISLKKVIIPSGVKEISKFAFDGCKNLVEVVINKGAKTIGFSAFNGCTKLKKITIPDSVENIGASAFANCINLEKIVLPKNIKIISKCLFENCAKLKSTNIPNGVEVISFSAFENCYNLENINIPDGVNLIEEKAFLNCKSLKKVVIPSSVKKIKANCFKYCESLKEIVIPSNVMHIGKSAFEYCKGLKKVDFSKGLLEIGENAFFECYSLKEILVPESVRTIGSQAFCNCKNLEKVTINYGIKEIKNLTFFKCSKLKEVALPESIVYIRSLAFCSCESLETIAIPSSVRNIDSAFIDCYNLKNVIIKSDNINIKENAFNYCKKLERINVLPGVQLENIENNFLCKRDENGYKVFKLGNYKKFNKEIYNNLIKSGFTTEEILNKKISSKNIKIKDLISIGVDDKEIKEYYKNHPEVLKNIFSAFNTFNTETYNRLKSFGIKDNAMLGQKIGKTEIDINNLKKVGSKLVADQNNLLSSEEEKRLYNSNCDNINGSDFKKLVNNGLFRKYGFVLNEKFYENAVEMQWRKVDVSKVTEKDCKQIIRDLWRKDNTYSNEKIKQIINFIFDKDYYVGNSRIDTLGESGLTQLKRILVAMQSEEQSKLEAIKYMFANNDNACNGRLNEILRQSSIILDSIELQKSNINNNENFEKSILMQFRNEWFNKACQKYSETATESFGVHYAVKLSNTFYGIFNINSYDSSGDATALVGADKFKETQGQAAEWFLKAFDDVYESLYNNKILDPTLFLSSIIESDENATKAYDIALQTEFTFDEYCKCFGKDREVFVNEANTAFTDIANDDKEKKEFNNWLNGQNSLTLEKVVQEVYSLGNFETKTVTNLTPELVSYITGENKKDAATELFTAVLIKDGIIIK